MTLRVRRPRFGWPRLADGPRLDVAAFLSGSVCIDTQPCVHWLDVLEGRSMAITAEELAALARLPDSRWVEIEAATHACGLDTDALLALVQRGIVLADPPVDETGRRRVERDNELGRIGWHPLAAAYHAHTAWRGQRGDEAEREHTPQAQRTRMARLCEHAGPPPPHLPRWTGPAQGVALPAEAFDDPLAALLRRRSTHRHFIRGASLGMAQLGRVLYGCFGVMGHSTLAPDVVALKRTSPSGGALHPIEAFVLVRSVAGVNPGWYHYRGDVHQLDPLRALTEAQAHAEADALLIGQTYFADAQAIVFHLARIDRHHWKYRNHAKAYKALLLDSGHLSQTFYLLATEAGLGAFYTAAVNDADAARLLGLDGMRETIVAANGLGVADPARRELDFVIDHAAQPGENCDDQ